MSMMYGYEKVDQDVKSTVMQKTARRRRRNLERMAGLQLLQVGQ